MNSNATYCANQLRDCKTHNPHYESLLQSRNLNNPHYESVLQVYNSNNTKYGSVLSFQNLHNPHYECILRFDNSVHPHYGCVLPFQNLNNPCCERVLQLSKALAKRSSQATTSIQSKQNIKLILPFNKNVVYGRLKNEQRPKTYGCGWPSFSFEMRTLSLASNCHASEASAVATRLVALWEGTEFPKDSYLRNAMSDFKDLAVRIDSAVDRKVRTAYDTEDVNRAQCLRSLYHLLKSAMASSDANVSAHAAVVYQTFRSCGLSVLRKGIDERTGHINSLLTDLAATEMQSHIVAVPGLSESISQLDAAQQVFEAKRVEYQSRRGAMSGEENASVLKLKVIDMVNNTILPYFGTMAKVKGGVYADFNDTLCQVVSSANASAKLHLRRKKTEAEQEPAYVAPTKEEEEPLTA